MKDKLWVAEYSKSQDAAHRQPLNESLKSNLARAIKKEANDYVIIAIGTMKDVGKAIDKLREWQSNA